MMYLAFIYVQFKIYLIFEYKNKNKFLKITCIINELISEF